MDRAQTGGLYGSAGSNDLHIVRCTIVDMAASNYSGPYCSRAAALAACEIEAASVADDPASGVTFSVEPLVPPDS